MEIFPFRNVGENRPDLKYWGESSIRWYLQINMIKFMR